MQFFTTAIALSVIALCTEAKVIKVDVGNGGLYFKPSVIVADIGDKVQFNFYNNHSVVQSNFAKPCAPIKNAFYSGFVASEDDGPAKDVFVITVNTKDAIWYYCSQGEHCQSGMAGAINAPGGEKALSSYLDSAIILPDNVTPNTGVSGGKLGPVVSSSSFSSSSSSKSNKVSSTSSDTSSKIGAIIITAPTTAITHTSSATPRKTSSNSAISSKTKSSVSTTPSPSKASRKHRVTKTTALAILTTMASLKTTSCTWRG